MSATDFPFNPKVARTNSLLRCPLNEAFEELLITSDTVNWSLHLWCLLEVDKEHCLIRKNSVEQVHPQQSVGLAGCHVAYCSDILIENSWVDVPPLLQDCQEKIFPMTWSVFRIISLFSMMGVSRWCTLIRHCFLMYIRHLYVYLGQTSQGAVAAPVDSWQVSYYLGFNVECLHSHRNAVSRP